MMMMNILNWNLIKRYRSTVKKKEKSIFFFNKKLVRKHIRCGYAEDAKKEVSGFARGNRMDEEKHDFASCIICGELATCTV